MRVDTTCAKFAHTTNLHIMHNTIAESRPEEKNVMVGVAEVERRASSLALPRWSNVVEDKVVVNLINKNNA